MTMKCAEAERLIHLYREGERTPAQDRALERHLRGCAACARLATEVRDDLAPTGLLRQERGAARPDADLTDRVMAGVRALEREGGRREPASRWWIHWQPLAVAAAAVLLLLLTGQELLTYHRLARLEQQVIAAGMPATGRGLSAVRPIEQGLEQLQAAGQMPGPFGPRGREGTDWMVVDGKQLARMLRSLGAEPGVVSLILEGLAVRDPSLTGIDAADGLDTREIEILLRHREEILGALRAL